MGKDHPEGIELLKTTDNNLMKFIELAINLVDGYYYKMLELH